MDEPVGLALRADGTLLVADGSSRAGVRAVWQIGGAPAPAIRLTSVSGDGQSAIVADALDDPLVDPLVVSVLDAADQPVPGVPVQFTGSEGVAVTTRPIASDRDGRAATFARAPLTVGTATASAVARNVWGDPLSGRPSFSLTAQAPAAGTIFTALNAGGTSSLFDAPALPAAATATPPLRDPLSIVAASNGTLYVGTELQAYAMTEAGELRLVAGTGEQAEDGDAGPAVEAAVQISDLALDDAGDRLFLRNNTRSRAAGAVRIRDVDLRTGVIDVFAGATPVALSEPYGDGASALFAQLFNPVSGSGGTEDMVFDGSMNELLFVHDSDWIRAIDNLGIIDTLVRQTIFGQVPTIPGVYWFQGATYAMTAAGGDVYAQVCFTRRTSPGPQGGTEFLGCDAVGRWDGTGWTIVAGEGNDTGEGVPAVDAEVPRLRAMTVDGSGRLLLAEPFRVRRIENDGTIRTIAGTGVRGPTGDYGPATSAALAEIEDIAVLPSGRVAIATGGSVRIVW